MSALLRHNTLYRSDITKKRFKNNLLYFLCIVIILQQCIFDICNKLKGRMKVVEELVLKHTKLILFWYFALTERSLEV